MGRVSASFGRLVPSFGDGVFFAGAVAVSDPVRAGARVEGAEAGVPGRGSGGGGKGLCICTGPVPFDADEHIAFGNGVFSVTCDQLVAQAGRKETGDLFIVSGTDVERIGVEFHVNGGCFHGCRYSVRICSFIAWRCRQVVGAD